MRSGERPSCSRTASSTASTTIRTSRRLLALVMTK